MASLLVWGCPFSDLKIPLTQPSQSSMALLFLWLWHKCATYISNLLLSISYSPRLFQGQIPWIGSRPSRLGDHHVCWTKKRSKGWDLPPWWRLCLNLQSRQVDRHPAWPQGCLSWRRRDTWCPCWGACLKSQIPAKMGKYLHAQEDTYKANLMIA